MGRWARGALGSVLGALVAVPTVCLAVGGAAVAELAVRDPAPVWESCHEGYCVRHEKVDRLLAADDDLLTLEELHDDTQDGGHAQVRWPFHDDETATAAFGPGSVRVTGEDGTVVELRHGIVDADER